MRIFNLVIEGKKFSDMHITSQMDIGFDVPSQEMTSVNNRTKIFFTPVDDGSGIIDGYNLFLTGPVIKNSSTGFLSASVGFSHEPIQVNEEPVSVRQINALLITEGRREN